MRTDWQADRQIFSLYKNVLRLSYIQCITITDIFKKCLQLKKIDALSKCLLLNFWSCNIYTCIWVIPVSKVMMYIAIYSNINQNRSRNVHGILTFIRFIQRHVGSFENKFKECLDFNNLNNCMFFQDHYLICDLYLWGRNNQIPKMQGIVVKNSFSSMMLLPLFFLHFRWESLK